MMPERCLHVPAERTVVVADLHIGYESSLEAEGVHIPRIQTAAIRDGLLNIIDRLSPDRLVVLGDLKHEFGRNLGQETRDVRSVLDAVRDRVEVVLVKGNHDNFLESIVSRIEVPVVPEYCAAGVDMVHGHKECGRRPLVIAHEHPSVRLFDSVGAFIKLPCFALLRKERLLVMPAFGPLTSGTDLTRATANDRLSPMLKGRDMSGAEIFACSEIGLLPLGRLSSLESLRL